MKREDEGKACAEIARQIMKIGGELVEIFAEAWGLDAGDGVTWWVEQVNEVDVGEFQFSGQCYEFRASLRLCGDPEEGRDVEGRLSGLLECVGRRIVVEGDEHLVTDWNLDMLDAAR